MSSDRSERREFPGWICPECGAWDSGSVMPRRAQWCDGACSHPKTAMVEIVFARRDERDSFREALGILAGFSSPETMERYRRELKRRRESALPSDDQEAS